MKNFKEIAEKCLAGELSGIFIFNTGAKLHSQYLKKNHFEDYFYLREFVINKEGRLITKDVKAEEIIDFIPDNMQEQIKIDIPEGKVPIMEQTKNGVVITWKEKELTYNKIYESLWKSGKLIFHITNSEENEVNDSFIIKVNVLRKLTNIRNYFGKPKHDTYGHALYYTIERGIHTTPALYPSNDQRVIFDTKEHAEQAIKMLGDELKYLFEPW